MDVWLKREATYKTPVVPAPSYEMLAGLGKRRDPEDSNVTAPLSESGHSLSAGSATGNYP